MRRLIHFWRSFLLYSASVVTVTAKVCVELLFWVDIIYTTDSELVSEYIVKYTIIIKIIISSIITRNLIWVQWAWPIFWGYTMRVREAEFHDDFHDFYCYYKFCQCTSHFILGILSALFIVKVRILDGKKNTT